jgi:hypothetical protein
VPDPVEEAAGRLYGLPLEDFTRERDATARELRKAKERDAAAAVAKLQKPTQASWAANHLARERSDLIDDLLSAGDALREAQEAAMSGEGAQELRRATADERRAVEALVAAAKELKPGGREPSEATLERLRTTLHAAATDDDVRAALEAGRLVADAEGSAFGLLALGAAGGEAAEKPKPKPKAAKPRKAKRATADEEESEREAAERAAAAQEALERRRRLEAELREARAESRSLERELGRAEREADRAGRRLEDAEAALEEAREQAEEAKQEIDSARDAASAARDHVARLEEQLD